MIAKYAAGPHTLHMRYDCVCITRNVKSNTQTEYEMNNNNNWTKAIFEVKKKHTFFLSFE